MAGALQPLAEAAVDVRPHVISRTSPNLKVLRRYGTESLSFYVRLDFVVGDRAGVVRNIQK